MRPRSLAIVVAAALGAETAGLASQAPRPVRFAPHDIASIRGGYAVALGDIDGDGLTDVVANSIGLPELAWYENPSWRRHVIVSDLPGIVNQAIADLDGDGTAEVAIQSAFAMQAAKSEGRNWIARSQGDPRGTWTTELVDEFPTSHHVGWADLDGDGTLELVNAPLVGAGSVAPTYDQDTASIFWYDQATWTRHVVDDRVPGIIHRVRPVTWDDDSRDALLVASFEGIALYRASGAAAALGFDKTLISRGHEGAAPRLGATDVGTWMNRDGRRIVASVEPWHGNEVVVYTRADGRWSRRVIFDQVQRGHEVLVLDLDGNGRGDIVANDNSRRSETYPDPSPGVHVFFSPDDPAAGEWVYARIERELAMNGCAGADLNLDGRPDLVCTGAGGVVRWYENLGAR